MFANYKWLWISIGLGLLVGLLWWSKKFLKSSKNSPQNPKKTEPMLTALQKAFNGSRFEKMIPLMIAQQKHESNNYTSRVFLEQNNPFGMKEAKVRMTTDIDDGTFIDVNGKVQFADKVGYSEYPGLQEAADDFAMYLNAVNFEATTDPDDFVFQLKEKNYFEDSYENYLRGVKYWMNK